MPPRSPPPNVRCPRAPRPSVPEAAEEEFAPPPPPDPPVPPDSLADRLLQIALVEAEYAIKTYDTVVVAANEQREGSQSRARQRVLEGALAAERAETLMRVRFALLGGTPNDAEGEMRLYLSFLTAAADDLVEVDVIDSIQLLENLPELTRPLRDAMARIHASTEADD